MSERPEILRNYSTLVARLWEDETLLAKLQADPEKVLKTFGLDVPEGAKVNLVIRELNVEGTPDTQVQMWSKGEQTGVFDVIVPLKPAGMDIDEIPLREEVLELIGGAGCCSPCCSCCPCCDSDAPIEAQAQ